MNEKPMKWGRLYTSSIYHVDVEYPVDRDWLTGVSYKTQLVLSLCKRVFTKLDYWVNESDDHCKKARKCKICLAILHKQAIQERLNELLSD